MSPDTLPPDEPATHPGVAVEAIAAGHALEAVQEAAQAAREALGRLEAVAAGVARALDATAGASPR